MPTKTDTHLLDFGIGMLMGLVMVGKRRLDERRLVDVHKAFVAAFKVIEAELEKDSLRFWMTTSQMYGTSPSVDTIFRHWLSSGYVTKDAPGTLYRFHVDPDIAETLLESLQGGVELYDKAVTAFIKYLDAHHDEFDN